MNRMEGELLRNKVDTLRIVEGRRRRGRLRWEDYEERFGRIGRGVVNRSEGWGEWRLVGMAVKWDH